MIGRISLRRAPTPAPAPEPPAGLGAGALASLGTALASQAIDLLPIPAAIVEARGDDIVLLFANSLFRAANITALGAAPTPPDELKDRISAFLASDKLRDVFDWQFGTSIDRRIVQATVARLQVRSSGRCMLTFIDRTAERRTEENLRREMMTDALTGLPNRAGFGELIEQRLRGDGADPKATAVLIIDLDRFSRVNACLGSLAGDELLITVARRLKGALRARDVLARTGGDEFGILMAIDDGRSDADHVARRIQAALTAPFRLTDFEIRVSCSIGIAFGADGIRDTEDLIRHAQFAVKRSKSTGSVEAHQSQAFAIAREQFALETALRRAIETDRLRLAYQPIWDLSSGRIVAFEALARWRDDAGVERSPADFIPVAEESGLIVPLGRWALTEATRQLADWDARAGGNCGTRFAVNISAIQMQRDHIPNAVDHALRQSGLTGDRLTLELTESALIADPDRVAQTMHALKSLGPTLAMDDFGTGYSNPAYLQKLPIDVLKMDRSFVTGMLADRDKIAIVRAILSLAQALGVNTTAEGVESNELAQTLAAMGCTYGQGFHCARPLDPDDAYALLIARNA